MCRRHRRCTHFQPRRGQHPRHCWRLHCVGLWHHCRLPRDRDHRLQTLLRVLLLRPGHAAAAQRATHRPAAPAQGRACALAPAAGRCGHAGRTGALCTLCCAALRCAAHATATSNAPRPRESVCSRRAAHGKPDLNCAGADATVLGPLCTFCIPTRPTRHPSTHIRSQTGTAAGGPLQLPTCMPYRLAACKPARPGPQLQPQALPGGGPCTAAMPTSWGAPLCLPAPQLQCAVRDGWQQPPGEPGRCRDTPAEPHSPEPAPRPWGTDELLFVPKANKPQPEVPLWTLHHCCGFEPGWLRCGPGGGAGLEDAAQSGSAAAAGAATAAPAATAAAAAGEAARVAAAAAAVGEAGTREADTGEGPAAPRAGCGSGCRAEG